MRSWTKGETGEEKKTYEEGNDETRGQSLPGDQKGSSNGSKLMTWGESLAMPGNLKPHMRTQKSDAAVSG